MRLLLICFCVILKSCTHNNVEQGDILGINNTALDNIELLPIKIKARGHCYMGTRMSIYKWDSMIHRGTKSPFLQGDIFADNDTIFLKTRDIISPLIIWNKIDNPKLYYELIMIISVRDPDTNELYEYSDTHVVYRIAVFNTISDTMQYTIFQPKDYKNEPCLGMKISKKYGIQGLFLCTSEMFKASQTDLRPIYFPKGDVLLQDTNTNLKISIQNGVPYHGWYEDY